MDIMGRMSEKVGPLPVIGWIAIGGLGIAVLAARSRPQAPAGGGGTVTLAPGDTTNGVTPTADQTIAGILAALKSSGATGANISLPGGGSIDVQGFNNPPGGGDLPPNPAPDPLPDTQPPAPTPIVNAGGLDTTGTPVVSGTAGSSGASTSSAPPPAPAPAPAPNPIDSTGGRLAFRLGPTATDALHNPY